MAKQTVRALAALLLLAPLWLYALPRVITLSPANTELAFAAGITPVGVSSFSDYPPQAAGIEQVATWQGMNLERIVALKPDLVLAWRGVQGAQISARRYGGGDLPREDAPLTLLVPGVPEAHQAWELAPGGLRPLRQRRVTGGVSVTLDSFLASTAVLFSARSRSSSTCIERRSAPTDSLAVSRMALFSTNKMANSA